MSTMLQEIKPNPVPTQLIASKRSYETPTEVGILDLPKNIQTFIALISVAAPEPSKTTTTFEDFIFGFPSPITELPRGEEALESDPSPANKLDAKLLSYKKLSHGWDGEEGVSPSPNAVSDAINFLAKKPEDISLPYPQIAADGEVGLYWHTDEVFAEVGFYGDGTYSYYASYSRAGNIFDEDSGENCTIEDNEWADRLLIILNKIDR